MDSTKYLIVGGGIAGTTAASTIRKLDSDGTLCLLTAENYSLYSRRQLSAYTRGSISRSDLLLRSEHYYESRHIDLRKNSLAVSLDTLEQIVTLADGSKINYHKLLLACGSQPRAWLMPGSQLAGIMPLRTMDQADVLVQKLSSAKHVLLVGGGFITLELIQTLASVGVATTVVIRDSHYWPVSLDEESSGLIETLINKVKNVDVLYQTDVASIEGGDKVEAVVLSNGKRLLVDMIITNIGVEPATDWLVGSGLTINGGVEVDSSLKTNFDSIWAAGDLALFDDKLLGVRHRLGNWGNATAQGELAGRNMAVEKPLQFDWLSNYSIDFFDTNICFLGDTHHHTGITAVPRGSARSGSYARLLVHKQKLVGATLINSFTDRQPIEDLIRSKVELNQANILDITDQSVPLRDLAARLLKQS